jgi:hypothetical protein
MGSGAVDSLLVIAGQSGKEDRMSRIDFLHVHFEIVLLQTHIME